MLSSFYAGLGGKLVERWAALSGPAIAFWLGGLLVWALDRGGLDRLSEPADWLDKQSTPAQIAVLAAILSGVWLSAAVVGRITLPMLRLLEGYWPDRPAAVGRLRASLVTRQIARTRELEGSFSALSEADARGTASGADRVKLTRVQERLRWIPSRPEQHMPTRLGNALRAVESRSVEKYGIDSVALWPHLWLVFPQSVKDDLAAARRALDASAAALIWGPLFLIFSVWNPIAVPIAVVVTLGAVVGWVPARTRDFARLVEAAVDLHRTALYETLRWPLPSNPNAERGAGRQLGEYLVRGLDGEKPTFR
jgi:hypothetical protein